jgi:hypothetical protein
MSKVTGAAVLAELEKTELQKGRKYKTVTRWEAFEQARLFPEEITCIGYQPVHRADNSCHTRLRSADQIIDHVNAEHGGGFSMKFRQTDGENWSGWRKLAEAGIEIQDFRCELCDRQVPLNAQQLVRHLKIHPSKIKNLYAFVQRTFDMTLATTQPLAQGDDAFDDTITDIS